jgi:hypothetical protein
MRCLLLAASLLPIVAFAAEPGFTLVPVKDATFEKNAYAAIEGVTAGPWRDYEPTADGVPLPNDARAERWRVLTVPPAVEGRPQVVVEKVQKGANGCCQRIVGRWRLEIPSDQPFTFGGWIDATSFLFELGGHQYTFSGLRIKDAVMAPDARPRAAPPASVVPTDPVK